MTADVSSSQITRMTPVGSTRNTDYFSVAPRILVAAPRPGTVDDGPSAEENVDFQLGFARTVGEPCGIVVLMGSLRSQDADARRVYAEKMDPKLVVGTALVVNNALARAMGSFFLGLTKPRIPVSLFPTVEACVPWLEERLRAADS